MGFFDSLFGRKKRKSTVIGGKAQELKKRVEGSDLIDERTREDILRGNFGQGGRIDTLSGQSGISSLIGASAELGRIGKLFDTAEEGLSNKFKSRMATQQLFNTLVDKPDSQRLRGGILNFGSKVRR